MRLNSVFPRFLSLHGVKFRVIHSDGTEEVLTGLINQIDGKEVIQFLPGCDIAADDKLINPAGDVFYVTDKKTDFLNHKPNALNVFYQTESEHNRASSVIQQLNAMRQLIQSKNSTDTDQLNRIVDLLSEIALSKEPMKQGSLARFSAVMERNSWITSAIASVLLSMMLQG